MPFNLHPRTCESPSMIFHDLIELDVRRPLRLVPRSGQALFRPLLLPRTNHRGKRRGEFMEVIYEN
jgi:hypothetical protein